MACDHDWIVERWGVQLVGHNAPHEALEFHLRCTGCPEEAVATTVHVGIVRRPEPSGQRVTLA